MQHLVAASLIFLILGIGTAVPLATAKALHDWAVSAFDATGTAHRNEIAQLQSGPSLYVRP